jgi:hypothetical protein
VTGAIKLDDEARVPAVEVDDELPDGVLAAEPGAEASAAQELPEALLWGGGFLTHAARFGLEL